MLFYNFSEFRVGNSPILVATDVAARGLGEYFKYVQYSEFIEKPSHFCRLQVLFCFSSSAKHAFGYLWNS